MRQSKQTQDAQFSTFIIFTLLTLRLQIFKFLRNIVGPGASVKAGVTPSNDMN